MAETQTAYKIALPLDGYESRKGEKGVYRSNSTYVHMLYYELGVKTVPEFGPIFCFSTLKDAEGYARNHTSWPCLILKGEAENVVKAPFALTVSIFREHEWPAFWEEYKAQGNVVPNAEAIFFGSDSTNWAFTALPIHTYFCDAFTPTSIEKVYLTTEMEIYGHDSL